MALELRLQLFEIIHFSSDKRDNLFFHETNVELYFLRISGQGS